MELINFNVRKSLSGRASRPTVENEAGWLKGLNDIAPDRPNWLGVAGEAVTTVRTNIDLPVEGTRPGPLSESIILDGLALTGVELREGVTVREMDESLQVVRILEALKDD